MKIIDKSDLLNLIEYFQHISSIFNLFYGAPFGPKKYIFCTRENIFLSRENIFLHRENIFLVLENISVVREIYFNSVENIFWAAF